MVRVCKAGRYYAMKVYSDQYLTRKRPSPCLAFELFQRESELLQCIHHTNIAAYVDSFSYENMYCLIQDYIPGNTLAALIQQGYCYSEHEVKKLLYTLLQVLEFLHSPTAEKPGIIHRDLRLSNIITNDRRLFIIDFGLACRLQNAADEAFLLKCIQVSTATDASSSYVKMRNDYSVQSDLFGAGVVAVDLFTNSVRTRECAPWEQAIPVSKPFKALIRQLLGVDKGFASCTDAIRQLCSLDAEYFCTGTGSASHFFHRPK